MSKPLHANGFTRLRWLFFIVVFPSLATLPLFVFLSYQRECRQLEIETQQTGRALSQLIDLELLDTARFVSSFGASSETLNRGDLATFYKDAKREFVKAGIVDGICLTDQNGQQLVNTMVPYGTSLPVIKNFDRIHTIFATGKPRISNLVPGPVVKRLLIAIDMPVITGNQVRYVLNAFYFPDRLNRFLKRQKLPEGWTITIFDRVGTITARSINATEYVGKKMIEPIRTRLARQSEGVLTAPTLEGVPSLVVFHQSEQTGIGVAITVPKAMLYGQLRKQYSMFAIAISLVILLSIYLAQRFGGFLEKQRHAEEELQEYRSQLEHQVREKTSSLHATLEELEETQFAMNKAGIGIVRVDTQTGQILWMNAYAADRLGYTTEDLNTLKLTDIDPSFQQDKLLELVETMRENGKARFETSIHTKRGHVVPVEVLCYQLQVDGIPISRAIAFVTDISARRRTESYLRALRDEMERLSHLQVARQTVAALAHELNQPLNAITSYAGAALRLLGSNRPEQEKLTQALEGCSLQAQRAGSVVRELLAFLSHGKIETEPVLLNNLVRSSLDRVKGDSPVAFSIELQLEPGLPPVLINRLQIEKVIVNLIRNAIEAMYENDRVQKIRIEVTTSSEPGMALVVIRDNGPGISPSMINRIFDPFFTTKAKGIGMGLAVSRAIVEAHGGQLWVDSEPGVAAAFHFTLPFAS